MAKRIRGRLGTYEMQPDRKVVIKADGTAEGQVAYKCDTKDQRLLPQLHSPHPDDNTLFAHNIDLTFNGNDLVTAIYSYFGLSAYYDGSNDIIECDSSISQVPIQTHPDFESFAGTPESPENGAIWLDATTGERTKKNDNAIFHGWSSGEFAGTTHYEIPRPTFRKISYKKTAPKLGTVMKIVNSVPGVQTPNGIKNFLYIVGSYRKAGGIYQVTEEWKGSPEPGWNKKIYK